jgi:type II secretory pathway pseudopilin PulG
MSKRSGYTLVEIMIIVAILTNVMLIAVPGFLRSRAMSQNTRYISDLRTVAGAFEMYAAENNRYPATTRPSMVPSGMGLYLDRVSYVTRNTLGGQWFWTNNASGSPVASIGSLSPFPLDVARMAEIDARIDNGVLATGAWRKPDATSVILIIEQ